MNGPEQGDFAYTLYRCLYIFIYSFRFFARIAVHDVHELQVWLQTRLRKQA